MLQNTKINCKFAASNVLEQKNMVILKCIALFFSILFSILFVNMKISSIVKLFAFNEEEDKKTTITILIVMLLSAISISIFYGLTNL